MGLARDRMTKRFTVPVRYLFSHSKIQLNGEPLTNDELIRILNTNDGAFVENFSLKQENEQLKQFKEYVFDLIDKEIKETKEIFEDGKIDLMMYNASMITLIGLKEQLKGDFE